MWKVYNITMKTMHIGEIAKRFGLNPRTIRYYETIGVLPKAERTESGYRLYAEDAIKRLEFVLKSKTLGLTLDEVRQILSLHDKGVAPCEHTKDFIKYKLREIDERIAALKSLKGTLSTALKKKFKAHSAASICPIIDQTGVKRLTFRTLEQS